MIRPGATNTANGVPWIGGAAPRTASHYNPFFYLIDGFRYGFIGHAEGSLIAGVGMTAGLVLAFACLCLWMFETGYKLKT